MRSIAKFYTWFWIIYFPTCIGFNDMPGFSSIDEVITVILIGYTWMKKGDWWTNKKPWKEFSVFLCLLTFYVIYSLIWGRNIADAVWLDLVQQIRPYSVIYCTWILNPQFSKKQRRNMLISMLLTLGAWLFYHPTARQGEEFPVLGQLAITTAMAYYLFTEQTKRNLAFSLIIATVGLLCGKAKYFGEYVAFIGVILFLKERMRLGDPRLMMWGVVLVVAVLFFVWDKFALYFVEGMDNEGMARPMTFKTSFLIYRDYFPFGSGMGTFATNAAWKIYSPLYPEYGLDQVWGLNRGGGFICDTYFPSLCQFGVFGLFFFLWFWKRRISDMYHIIDFRYYKIAMMSFLCLFIENTADSSYLSGKGMGYFMLLGICLNANRTMAVRKQKLVQAKTMKRKVITHEENKGLVVET